MQFSAQLTVSQKEMVEAQPQILRVWEDSEVHSTSIATQQTFSPIEAYDRRNNWMNLSEISSCQDGYYENFGGMPSGSVRDSHQNYFLFDISNIEDGAQVQIQFDFKERNVNQALLWVYQPSTDQWHQLNIDPFVSDNTIIHSTFDLTELQFTAQDLANLEIYFQAAKIRRARAYAKIDCVNIHVSSESEPTTASGATNVNAAPVWAVGNLGDGVGVAVIDSGIEPFYSLTYSVDDGSYNSYPSTDGVGDGVDKTGTYPAGIWDDNGHGTAIASMISNMLINPLSGEYFGIAPNSHVIPITTLDENGKGNYSTIISGVQWAIENKDAYNIRIINMSLSAPVKSHYWDDPLNQAVMRAWAEGIVVVAAAGNKGPDPMSIGVPGNNPYVITVGALSDARTPSDWQDDYVPSFSATGPNL